MARKSSDDDASIIETKPDQAPVQAEAPIGLPTKTDGTPSVDPRLQTGDQQQSIGVPQKVDPSLFTDPAAATPAQPEAITYPFVAPPGKEGVFDLEAPPDGIEGASFEGDPDVFVMPGTDVYYWVRSHRAGLMEPHVMKVLDRLSNGAYSGQRYRPVQNGVFAVAAARPSPVPKLGHFTPIRRFHPDVCKLKPGE